MQDNYSEFVTKFIKHDKSVIEPFIEMHFKILTDFVKKFGGNKLEAEDLMQDALYVFYNIIKNKRELLNVDDIDNIDNYFRGVYKNIWYRKFNDSKMEQKAIFYNKLKENLSGKYMVDNIAFEEIIREEKYKLYRNYLAKLGKNCQKILKMLQLGISLKEIAKILNYSIAYMYKMKTNCKKKLIESIKNDPYYDNYV